jgi:hypothetical protein
MKKKSQVLDFAVQSGEMWQMPFENYDGELIYLKEGTNIKLGNDEMEIRFTPVIHPAVFVFIMSPVVLLSVVMFYLMEVLDEPICPAAISKL